MPERGRALIEVYDDGFGTTHAWGGVETALWYLVDGLRRAGVEVDCYPEREGDPAMVADRVRRDRVHAVFPLVESDLFAGAGSAELSARVVRIWHDVSRIAPDLSSPPACPAHVSGTSAQCTAAPAHPDGPTTEVFLRPAEWTRCFRRAHVIPWAADHLPRVDAGDPHGPLVLQLGKVDNDTAERCVRRLLAHGRSLRLIFSGWSRTGRSARHRFAHLAGHDLVELIDTYDVRSDWARVFAGASALVLPSRFHETFNFLAAESVQVGVPVVALGGAGELGRFASWQAADLDALTDRLLTEPGSIAPRPRAEAGWAEVARRYAAVIAGLT